MSTKNEIIPPPKDEEELELERIVFDDLKGFESSLKDIDREFYEQESDEYSVDGESDSDSDVIEEVEDDQLFFVDDGQENKDHMDVDKESTNDEVNEESETESESDAWIDSEDEGRSISLLQSDKLKKLRRTLADDFISGKVYVARLRSQFEKIYPKPKWVEEDSETDDNDRDEDLEIVSDEEKTVSGDIRALSKILLTSEPLTNTKTSKILPPVKLDIIRLKDANQKHSSKSAIQALSFHSTHPLLLTSGYDRSIRIYHIDGSNNYIVSTIHLRDTPIQTAQFHPHSKSNKVFAGGRRRYMYSWDLQTGAVKKISRMYGHESTQKSFENFKLSPKGSFIGLMGNSGWVNILSAATSQWVQGFKIEGTLVDFDWSVDESFVIVTNSVGEVWEFSMNSGKVLQKWRDETGVGITKIRIGGKNNRFVAIGSESGIVSIYDRLTSLTKSIGTLGHLTTTISTLEFNHDGQILCIASRAKKDSLRLVHLPSCKVFQNWPTSGTPLGKVTSVQFSPNSEMICIANEAGKARLWRLNHY